MSGVTWHFDRRQRTALAAFGLAIGMVGVGFAAVPLYDLFCRVTGFAGTTMQASEGEAAAVRAVAGKTMSVRFDSNVAPGVPLRFRPERPTETVTVGARDMMIFLAKNESAAPVTVSATFNVTPSIAGPYFAKIQCFCFTEQRLEPGEEVRMPVVYYVDPALLDDREAREVQEITLSYTFFAVDAAGAEG